MIPFLALVTILCALWSSPGNAATPHASVGLYLTDPVVDCNSVQPFGCDVDPPPQVTGNLNTPYYVFLAVFNGDPDLGIAGLTCGIDYNSGSTFVHEWQPCNAGGNEYPGRNWPAPGGGNVLTFNKLTDCQTNEPEGNGVTAIFGYFYVTAYGSDRMAITENRALQIPSLAIAECDPPAETELNPEERAGYIGFSSDGSEEGHLPCVEKAETTWGQLKTRYGQD